MTVELDIRLMEPAEREAVEALKGIDKIVNEFLSLWKRWGNWDKHPPVIIITDDGDVVGLHGFTATKSGYINSYFLWVDESFRGMRLAGDLIDVTLQMRPEHCQRWKIRNIINGDGYNFWTGFGLVPVGVIPDKNEALFDFTIQGISTIKDLIKHAGNVNDVVTTDKRSLTHYRKLGVEFIDVMWEEAVYG